MTIIEILFGIVVFSGFYLGFSRGIIKTVFTVLSLVFGLMAAFKFAPATTKFLETTFRDDNPLFFLAGFLLSFIIMMLLIRTLARGLEGVLKTANINIVNQLAGGVLLGGIFVLIFSTLLTFSYQTHLLSPETKEKSMTYPYLEQYPTYVYAAAEKMKPMFQEFWDQSIRMMDRMEEMSIEQTEETTVEDRSDELSKDEGSTN